MKGTFFSADFIIDENDSPRIIELNTDTACITSTLNSHFDFSGFKTLCSDNNITKITIIYKEFQSNFVKAFESYIESDMTFITEVDKIREANSSIYTTLITDESDRFILRMAYDENAVFDSTYCKDRVNLLNIFNENGVSGSTPEYYYSGSGVEYNTFDTTDYDVFLGYQTNRNNRLPDIVEKPHGDTPHSNLAFGKFVGGFDSSSTELYADYINNYLDRDNYYTEKFHISHNALTSGSVESIRMFGVVYGAEINFLQFGSYKIEGMWDLPDNLDDSGFDMGSDSFVWKLPKCHYYELTTNFRKSVNGEFVMDTEKVQLVNNSFEDISNLEVSQSLKSYYISGSPSPNTDDLRFFSWSHDGNTLPSESTLTSSIVYEMYSESYDSEFLVEINLDAGDGIYVGENKAMLVYDSGSDEFRFKRASNLTSSVDYLIDENQNKIGLNSVNFVLPMSASSLEFMKVDVEETDTYFVSASTPFIVHNAPCFVAGTKVHIEDKGVTNIEDVEVGDKVASYNHGNDTVEYREVLKVQTKENQNIVKYIFENGTELLATPDHPLFVIGKGYSSYSPKDTKEDSNLDVEQILLGDEVLHIDGYGVTITDIIEQEETHTVYNLDEVDTNNNFFVEDLLAHNRFVPQTCFAAGTQIKMEDGTTKNIEDVIVGDRVIGWDYDNEKEKASDVTAVDHTHTVDSHRRACATLGYKPSLFTVNDTDIAFTPEHPFLTKDGWKSLVPDHNQQPYLSNGEPKVLVVGDSILVNGEWEEIKHIDVLRQDETEKVYNITVADVSSYIANGIVVHNK